MGVVSEVDALSENSTGVWLVQTRDSSHVFDLERGLYARRPGPGAGPLPFDGQLLRLDRVLAWPSTKTLAGFIIFIDDPNDPAVEHWRVSSFVQRITAWPDEGEPEPAGTTTAEGRPA